MQSVVALPRNSSRSRSRSWVAVAVSLLLTATLAFAASYIVDARSSSQGDLVESDGRITEPDIGALPPTDGPTAALTDRSSCSEIRGTQYRSAMERSWYLANCAAAPTPTSVPPTATPSSRPQAPGVAIPGNNLKDERWILVDIANQVATAFIGDSAVYTALVTTGKAGWETPTGTFRINYRVANETMTSASIAAEEYYVLENVLYTQYFTNEGHALHLNYWRPDYYFGNIPSSHGCVGMRLADAEFFWRFATVGTRITIR